MNPRISIIILNWNGWEDTIECLESLYRITYPNYDVIVVDNDSKNESVQKIREYCGGEIEVESKFFEYSGENKPIKIIEYTREEAEAGGGKEGEIVDSPHNRRLVFIKNKKNYGFAEGNNIGIRYALKALNPDYVLLLNNDTVVDPEFLGELVKVGESDGMIGFVGAKVYFYDKSNLIQFTGGGKIELVKGRAPRIASGETDNGQYDSCYEVGYIGGSCLLCKTDVVKKVGVLDPAYFAYWEETDWCLRGSKIGYKSIYVFRSKIWHKGGASGGSCIEAYYLARNRFYFIKQHATKKQYLSFLIYFFGFQFWYMGYIYSISHKNINAFMSFLRGTWDGIKGVH
ncbi:MAG: glycosyltransferase family 2 protein [Candidatus Methanogaster sp.]|uniref:Glycosyltransferase family 2 protein n=1 Tax=Candidatus Methanogaster sp. TaxID=3386292 RepID=A0AC61L4A7_9EURY|nr:MAG: glycosyltransferase family 2 protein [ANME-2 cluster archaeon]